jgi:glycosyltransferase involved in cell wall biosynthesis
LKIAVWHNLPSGGGKRALHDHVRGLVMRGHRVESWSPPTANLSYMPLGDYATEHIVSLDPPPTHATGRGPRGRVEAWLKPLRDAVARVEAMVRHSRQCAEEIERGGFDLVLGASCLDFAAPFIARFVRAPTVLYLQEPYRHHYEAQAFWDMPRLPWVAPRDWDPGPWTPLRWWKQAAAHARDAASVNAIRLHAREEILNAQAFGRVLCNSRFSQETIRRVYRLDAKVCYLGIDPKAFPAISPLKEKFVIGLGAFGMWKGIDLAIRAIATIEAPIRPSLVWVGNMADEAYLQDMKTLAEGLRVVLVPRVLVSQDELVSLLGRAAAMIYTSRLEPFGYAPLEANACGTSVVGIAEGGIRETIEPGVNGLLVEPGDPVGLGRAVLKYVENLDASREDGIRARNHVLDRWGLDSSIDRLESHLLEEWEARHSSNPALAKSRP